MTKKRVILYATKFMNIYQDIVSCLENMEFEVIWIEANTIPNNPFNKTLGLYNQKNIDDYMSKADKKWRCLLEDERLKKSVDYILSIDGMDIPMLAFEQLSLINPKIRKVLYMYDRVEGVYQIDRFFNYYDEVFSFDISDCKKFNISFLPIYWVSPIKIYHEKKYDIFAYASYSGLKPERTRLFSQLKRFINQRDYNGFVKLYDKSYGSNRFNFIIKNLLKNILRRNTLTLRDMLSGLITEISVTPDQYRDLIYSSGVVFDTQASYQDGLTARFMWALGAGKKIITTNQYALTYDFYNDGQIFILKNNFHEIDNFLKKTYTPDFAQQKKILPYRIDNWIKRILKIEL